MRLLQPRWLALCASLIIAALIPQLLAQDGDGKENTIYEEPQATTNSRADTLRTLLRRLAPAFLKNSKVQPRSPWETPPTAYLPYPPPPNYVWPPGPHTQYPPPSETNAPGGWYGGTGTGGQGNSGAGSASNSGSTSFAAPRLQIPSPMSLLIYLLPPSILPARHQDRLERANRRLKARDPVETPPTQYLPYPPPPNYQYPPGQNAQNQNPRPSEFDPPPGVYGAAGNPNANVAGQGSSTQPFNTGKGGAVGGRGWGKGHVAWVVIVAIIATALVVGAWAWWYRGKRLNAPPEAAAAAGEKDKEGGGFMAVLKKMKGEVWKKKKKKKNEGGRANPPPAANDDDDDDD